VESSSLMLLDGEVEVVERRRSQTIQATAVRWNEVR